MILTEQLTFPHHINRWMIQAFCTLWDNSMKNLEYFIVFESSDFETNVIEKDRLGNYILLEYFLVFSNPTKFQQNSE